MATILPFQRRTETQTKRLASVRSETTVGTLVLFTGVRYERVEPDTISARNSAPRDRIALPE